MGNGGECLVMLWNTLTRGIEVQPAAVHLHATRTLEVAVVRGFAHNLHISLHVHANANAAAFGIRMRGAGNCEQGYELIIQP